MPKWQRNLFFVFFMLAGVIVGALIAGLSQGVPGLDWLAYGEQIGISADAPMVVDLAVAKVAFGLEMGINVAQIICIIAAFFIYRAFIGRR